MSGETDLGRLLATMRPAVNAGRYTFATFAAAPLLADVARAVALVREAEGTTLVLPDDNGDLAWITLTVHSSLAAVGLTAAVAECLTARNISCNVVAAYFHDHIFVPHDRAADAVEALDELTKARARLRAPNVAGTLGATGRSPAARTIQDVLDGDRGE